MNLSSLFRTVALIGLVIMSCPLALPQAAHGAEKGITAEQYLKSMAPITAKLKGIVIPAVDFKKAALAEVIGYLEKKSFELDTREKDPARRGVKIGLKLDSKGVDPAARLEEAPVTLSLRNIPLGDLIEYVAMQANVKVKVEPESISIVPMDAIGDVFFTREVKAEPDLIDAAKAAAEAAAARPAKPVTPVRYDVAWYWELQGLTFPLGASAIYNPETNRVIIRNTAENLRYFDSKRKEARDGGVVTLQEPDIPPIQAKLNRIIIPQLEFKEATVGEAIEFLRKKSIELDMEEKIPARRGVNIINLEPTNITPAAVSADGERITISLENVPLGEALKYVTSLANLKYRIEENAVVITPISQRTGPMITREYKMRLGIFKSAQSAMRGGAAAAGKREIPAWVDVTGDLQAGGVEFPPGAWAIYNIKTGRVYVHNTGENMELLDQLVEV